ncbi:hypothetical protein VTN31DRAFT_3020 [Thermomyces dupontii]|uniref:uncharacterized protein n=1 Tax=Talaromyces thermophilus TaxID=28565 RepID=UPI0037427FD8
MAALVTAKKELRRRIQRILREIPPESISSQSATATSRLLALPEYRSAKRISVFLSMPQGEISTTGIVRDALTSGKEVYVPYTHKVTQASVMDMLRLYSMDDFESLKPDKWGIPSLAEESIPTRQNCFGGHGIAPTRSRSPEDAGLDLIVLPGVAFDTGMRRLGHGKGYYDHFLNRYNKEVAGTVRANSRPYLVAVALREQLLLPPEEIPVGAHDRPVDAIIVGDGRLIKPEP